MLALRSKLKWLFLHFQIQSKTSHVLQIQDKTWCYSSCSDVFCPTIGFSPLQVINVCEALTTNGNSGPILAELAGTDQKETQICNSS